MVSAIVAIDKNNVIGHDGDLPWRLSADLRHFKELTSGNTIIMGRKTYDSIGQPLPRRQNIVITRKKDLKIPGCITVNSLQEAFDIADANKTIFIIGGGEVYRLAWDKIKRIYLTEVDAEIDGDVTFPRIKESQWREIDRQSFLSDDKNEYNYTFRTLERRHSG